MPEPVIGDRDHGATDLYLRAIAVDRASIGAEDGYPFSLPCVAHLRDLPFTTPVTFFVGENGSGKSTVLEAIAVAMGFNAEGGSRNFRFATRASHSPLHEVLHPIRGPVRPRDGFFLRAESLFNVATEIERLDEDGPGPPIADSYGPRALHEQSHGESFLALVQHRFLGSGLYLLDEPEAALSPTRQMSLLALVHDLVGARSQFIIATHSPILLSYPGATIYELGDDGLTRTTYEETEHFQVTRDFLNHYPTMLRTLLSEDMDP